MDKTLYIIFILIAIFRITVLLLSQKHEKQLLQQNATEYNRTNTKIIAILHTLFYFACFFEGIYRKTNWDSLTTIGLILVFLSYLVLLYVIHILGDYWTVKLIFAPDHKIIKNWLFDSIKHPNYFLNILPELVGVTLIFHAWITFSLLILPYIFCLSIRIRSENKLIEKYDTVR
jgi:isoprenylcysteine carboxyl methyltransferase (ICMT) family protein YpbQ